MDPVSTVIVDADTTYAFMREAEARGHRVDHCLIGDVFLRNGTPHAVVRKASTTEDRHGPIGLAPPETVALTEVDVVFIRKDPPFERNYLWLTLLLEMLRGKTLVVNDPRGIRDANEKLYACRFPDLTPETMVTNRREHVQEFVRAVGGTAVLKPIDGHGGKNVFVVKEGDLNANAIYEVLTDEGRHAVMVQRYIPEVRLGDKRILVLEGEAIGAILRVPAEGEARSNIHVGGSVKHATLDDDDRRIVDGLRERLRLDGLFFVGLDVIGGQLTEVNVTSPTGIQQASRLSGENLSALVIDALESKVRSGIRSLL